MTASAHSPPDTTAAGIAIMSTAMLLAPAMDVIAKVLTDSVSPGQIAFARLTLQTALLLPIVIAMGEWCRPRWQHAAGGLCLAIALVCIISAVSVMPVANALAIFFVEPLLLTLLSALLLGERIGWRRLSAVLMGLLGVLVVLRPNVAQFGWQAILPLVTAFSFALYLIITRVMAQRGQRIALQFWTGAFAALALGVMMLATLPFDVSVLAPGPITLHEAGLLLMMGLLACITHQMVTQAFARAEAGVLAPLQYLEILSGTLLGWLVFGDFPDALTWAGTAIIVAAGLYVFSRERRHGRLPSERRQQAKPR